MTAPVETSTPIDTEGTDTAAETPTPAVDSVEETKEPVDTTDFEAAVEALLAAVAQDAAGDHSDELFAVRSEYHDFNRAGKNAARKIVEDRAHGAIMNSELAAAQALLSAKDEMLKPLPASGTPRAPRAPKNATDDVVQAIAAIQLAYSLSMLKAHGSTELDADWQERISANATSDAQDRTAAYAAWLEAKQEGEEPAANDVEKAAARISLGRAPKGQGRKPKAVEEAAKISAETAEAAEAAGVAGDAEQNIL